MKKMAVKRKTVVLLIGAIFFIILCFSLVQNASIRKQSDVKDGEDVESKASDNLNQDLEVVEHQGDTLNVNNKESKAQNLKLVANDVQHDTSRNVHQNQIIPEKILKPPLKEDIQMPLGMQQERNVDNVEADVNVRYRQSDDAIKNIGPRRGKQDRGISEERDKRGLSDEEGAGEYILKEEQPLQRKALPIVKAYNKIDAIVDTRLSDGLKRVKDKLDLNDLQPPDHLDAVRMEQDGHLNRDYKKEVFLGNHEELDNLDDEEAAKKLEQIFLLVDTNHNNFLTVDELEEWIIQKVQEHFQEAKDENAEVFRALDTDNDGYITWREFHTEFLVALGMDAKSAEQHAAKAKFNEDYDEYEGNANARGDMPLESEDRERLVRYRIKWSEADEEPQDNKLNLEEFQSFRHPEQSKTMLLNMVEDIIENLDKNDDGIVSEEEFVALSPVGAGPDIPAADKQWQAERRKEFRGTIDINHDGKLTKDELINYVDPQNRNHAKMEARNLLELGDENNDDRLSLDEVLDNMDLFLGSKMVDTGRSFHDEF